MKKNLIITTLVSALTISAFGQKLDAAKVPEPVKTTFTTKYSGITPKWEKEDGNYEASFKQNGKSISAMFTPVGIFTESEMDIAVSDLPATVLAYLKDHYAGKTIKEGAKITKADGTVNYEAEVNGKDVIFDANGRFLKEVKD
jgi:hypothetical protein